MQDAADPMRIKDKRVCASSGGAKPQNAIPLGMAGNHCKQVVIANMSLQTGCKMLSAMLTHVIGICQTESSKLNLPKFGRLRVLPCHGSTR